MRGRAGSVGNDLDEDYIDPKVGLELNICGLRSVREDKKSTL